jgi:hypothetical protein
MKRFNEIFAIGLNVIYFFVSLSSMAAQESYLGAFIVGLMITIIIAITLSKAVGHQTNQHWKVVLKSVNLKNDIFNLLGGIFFHQTLVILIMFMTSMLRDFQGNNVFYFIVSILLATGFIIIESMYIHRFIVKGQD